MKRKSMTKAAALWELYEMADDLAEVWLEMWCKASLAYWFETEGHKLYARQ